MHASVCLLAPIAAQLHAQVSLDGSLGRAGALAGPNFQVSADLGQQVGRNLFHSFSQFNLAAGETATFSGPGEVQNILARVTGGNASSINGTIRSAIPGANMLLLNPAGVLFQPNAAIDVSGSFAVSTADYAKLGDGGRFSATASEASVLTSAPVEAFGFLGAKAASIYSESAKLGVGEGKSISVVGGDIEIKGGEIRAPGGQVNLASVQSAGEVANAPRADLGGFTALGEVRMAGGTVVNVGGGSQPVYLAGLEIDPVTRTLFPRAVPHGSAAAVKGLAGGGSVSIRGGSLVMDRAALYHTTEGNGSGGSIDIGLRGEGLLRHQAHLVTTALGTGRAGDIHIQAGSLSLEDRSSIYSTVDSGGRSGDVSISTGGDLRMINGNSIVAMSFNTGDAGNVTVATGGDLRMENSTLYGNLIGTQTIRSRTGGAVGDVKVDSRDITILTHPTAEPLAGLNAIGSRTLGAKNSGAVDIQARKIEVDGGERPSAISQYSTVIVSTSRDVNATGNSGDIRIVADEIELRNRVSINTDSSGKGNAGSVDIRAREIRLLNWGVFNTSLGDNATGNAGNVFVEADRLAMIGGGEGKPSNIGSFTRGTGNGGSITIHAGEMEMANNAGIYASTLKGGTAGEVKVRTGPLSMSHAVITAAAYGWGNGGNVEVESSRLRMANTAQISAYAEGIGHAGDIRVKSGTLGIDQEFAAAVPFSVSGHDIGSFAIGAFSRAANGGRGGSVSVEAGRLEMKGTAAVITAAVSGVGDGGAVRVTAGSLRMDSGAAISSSSERSGDSGTIAVDAVEGIVLRGGSAITTRAEQSSANGITARAGTKIELFDSKVTAEAALDGGELRLEAPIRISLVNSQVNSEAGMDGGNIFIDPQFVTLNNSQITANAILGNGGNIQVATDFLISSTDSAITASSQFGVNGTISVLGPAVDLTGSLASLSGSLMGAESRLPEHCGMKLGADLSSFLILGRGGLPAQADGWLPSHSPLAEKKSRLAE